MLKRLIDLVPPPPGDRRYPTVPPVLRPLLEAYGPGTFLPELDLYTPDGDLDVRTEGMREVHELRADEGPIEAGIVWAGDSSSLSLHLLADGSTIAVLYELFEAVALPGTPEEVVLALVEGRHDLPLDAGERRFEPY